MAKRKWLQSLDLSVGDDGLPVFESALSALAALIEDGRLKVDASGITLNVENIDIDVADITGAAPNRATLYDLGTQINLVRGPDAENRQSLNDVVGALAPLTSLAAQITGTTPDSKTLADLFDQFVAAQAVGRFVLSNGFYASLGDIYTAVHDVSNTIGGQDCVNVALLGANGTFINETDYALNTYTKLDLDTYGGALPIAGPGGNSIPVDAGLSFVDQPGLGEGFQSAAVTLFTTGGSPVAGGPTGELIAILSDGLGQQVAVIPDSGPVNRLATNSLLYAMTQDYGMGGSVPAPLYVGDTGGLRIDCSYSYVNLAAGSDDFAHIPLKCTNDQRLLVSMGNLTVNDDLNLGLSVPLKATSDQELYVYDPGVEEYAMLASALANEPTTPYHTLKRCRDHALVVTATGATCTAVVALESSFDGATGWFPCGQPVTFAQAGTLAVQFSGVVGYYVRGRWLSGSAESVTCEYFGRR